MNQGIFNTQFLHFAGDEFRASIQPQRWERYGPRSIVIMNYCDSSRRFIERLPRNSVPIARVINHFLKPSGEAYSIVSLITHGIIRESYGKWCVMAYPNGLNIECPIPPQADIGIIPSPFSLELLPKLVEGYVRTHRHSLIQVELLPA